MTWKQGRAWAVLQYSHCAHNTAKLGVQAERTGCAGGARETSRSSARGSQAERSGWARGARCLCAPGCAVGPAGCALGALNTVPESIFGHCS